MPEEQWSPTLEVLNGDRFLTFKDGELQLPDIPGIGLDVDEDAIEKFCRT